VSIGIGVEEILVDVKNAWFQMVEYSLIKDFLKHLAL